MEERKSVEHVKTLIIVDLPGVASVLEGRDLFDYVTSVPGGTSFHAAVGNMQFLYTEEPSTIGFIFADSEVNRDLAEHLASTAGYHVVVVTPMPIGSTTLEVKADLGTTVNDLFKRLHVVAWLPVLLPASDGDVSLVDSDRVVAVAPPAADSAPAVVESVEEDVLVVPPAPASAPAPAPDWLSSDEGAVDDADAWPLDDEPESEIPAPAEVGTPPAPVALDPSAPPPPPSWLGDLATPQAAPPPPPVPAEGDAVKAPVVDMSSPPPPPSWLSDLGAPAEPEAPAAPAWGDEAPGASASDSWLEEAAPLPPSMGTPPAVPWESDSPAPPTWDAVPPPPPVPSGETPPPPAWEASPADLTLETPPAPPAWGPSVDAPAPPVGDPAPLAPPAWDAAPPAPPAPTGVPAAPGVFTTPPSAPAWEDAPPPPAPTGVPVSPAWESEAPPPPPATAPWEDDVAATAPLPWEEQGQTTPVPAPPAPFTPEGMGSVPLPSPAPPSWVDAGVPSPPAPPADWSSLPVEPEPAVGIEQIPSTQQTGAPMPKWREVGNWAPTVKPRRRNPDEPIKIISITVPKGGTGKTSTSVNGASLLASTGKRVLYVDANAQQADGADLLGIPASAPTIMDLTHGAITRERALSACVKIPGTENLSALLGPRDPRQANPLLLTPQVYCEAVDVLVNDFDYILIDGPIAEIFREIIELFILTRSDFILSAVTPDVKTVMNTYKWFTDTTGERFAGAAAYPADQIGWFLNRYEDDVAFDEADARASLRRPNEAEWRYLGKVPDLKSVRRAGNLNQVPDDPEYVANLAQVFYNAIGDPALLELANAAGRKGPRRRSRKG